MTPAEIVEFLRMERHRRRLTMQQISELSAVSVPSICQWENGEMHMPNLRNLDLWARALGFKLKLTPLTETTDPAAPAK